MIRHVLAHSLLAASLAFGPGALRASSARAETLRDTTPSIAVIGEATQEAAPDRAVLRFGVVSEKATAMEAAAANNKIAESILAELKALGLADADLRTENVSLEPFTNEERDAKGKVKQTQLYRARNDMAARIKPVEKAGEVAGRIVDKGVNNFQGVEFEFADPSARLDALRGAAVKDAQRRAQAYVEAAGMRLGRVLEIRPLDEASPPVAFAMKAEARGAPVGAAPMMPGTQRLVSRVSIIWALSR